eukprot:COSAG02_NODE_2435_length_8869_cov_63.273774_6_plen_79_part_00
MDCGNRLGIPVKLHHVGKQSQRADAVLESVGETSVPPVSCEFSNKSIESGFLSEVLMLGSCGEMDWGNAEKPRRSSTS